MRLKQDLPTRDLSRRQLVLGLAVGSGVALFLYFVSLWGAMLLLYIADTSPQARVESIVYNNAFWEEYSPGFPPEPVPEIVGSAEPNRPIWFAPFWAGLSAALGHAVFLGFCLQTRRAVPGPQTRKARRRATLGIASGLAWIGLSPLILVKIWFFYLWLVYRGNIWHSAFALPGAADPDPFVPFFPFGLAAFAFVAFVVLEPWRMLQLAYRCRWWPAVALATTATVGVLIWALGYALVPRLP